MDCNPKVFFCDISEILKIERYLNRIFIINPKAKFSFLAYGVRVFYLNRISFMTIRLYHTYDTYIYLAQPTKHSYFVESPKYMYMYTLPKYVLMNNEHVLLKMAKKIFFQCFLS